MDNLIGFKCVKLIKEHYDLVLVLKFIKYQSIIIVKLIKNYT